MQEMVVYGVSFDMVGKQPIVLLKTSEGNKFLPIWIGHPEAAAILVKLQGAATQRPMTHDLLTDILGQLNARVVQIAVTESRTTPSMRSSRSRSTVRRSRSTSVPATRSPSPSVPARRSSRPTR